MLKSKKSKVDTLLAKSGRSPTQFEGSVNTPVFRSSTIIFSNLEKLLKGERAPFDSLHYGRLGTLTQWAFEDAVTKLEGGYKAVSTSSGLNMIATTLLAFTSSGKHILVPKNVYGGVRRLCEEVLKPLGIEVEFYGVDDANKIERLIRKNTSLVYVESPGSSDLAVSDLPKIARAAKSKNILVVADNTWATPLFYKPLDLGADVSIHSATKYLVGHSDVTLGIAVCTQKVWPALKRMSFFLGASASPDDAYLALRGLRTLRLRMDQHQTSAIKIAKWLEKRTEIEEVFYPALKSASGHRIWKRDFCGASGRLAFKLKKCLPSHLANMLNQMVHFEMGFGWGGYESLIIPDIDPNISLKKAKRQHFTIRLSVGLENVDDLISDLSKALVRLNI